MKDMFKNLVGTTLAVFVAVIVALLIVKPASAPSKLGDTIGGYPLTIITPGSVNLASGTSTLIALPDTSRSYGYLCNTDGAANEFLGFSNFSSTATNTAFALGNATTTQGVVLFPKTCFTLTNGNNTWGQITGTTASSATTTLLYIFGH